MSYRPDLLLDADDIIQRANELCREQDGELKSRQVKAAIRALVQALNQQHLPSVEDVQEVYREKP